MGIVEFAEAYPCARRRLEDGEAVIPTYTHQGRRGWWGRVTPYGGTDPLWYLYFPFHRKPQRAISRVEQVLGHPVDTNSCSDEEVYFWVPEGDARVLMVGGPPWCRVRRKAEPNPLPARGEGEAR